MWHISTLLICAELWDMRASHVYKEVGATTQLSLWTHKLLTYLHPWESHNQRSSTSAVSCKRATSLGEARLLAGVERQSFTWTGEPGFAAALVAWSAKALIHKTGSFDLVRASHYTTAIDWNWHAFSSSLIILPCLTGVPEDVMNPRLAHKVPKSCKKPKAYLESIKLWWFYLLRVDRLSSMPITQLFGWSWRMAGQLIQ